MLNVPPYCNLLEAYRLFIFIVFLRIILVGLPSIHDVANRLLFFVCFIYIALSMKKKETLDFLPLEKPDPTSLDGWPVKGK